MSEAQPAWPVRICRITVRLTCVFARDNLTSKPVYDDGRWRGHGGNNSGEGTPLTGYMDKRVSIVNICQLYSQYI
jgi:hypothetical protein